MESYSEELLLSKDFNTEAHPVVQHLGRNIELHSWKGENGNIYFRRYHSDTNEYEETVEIQTNVLPRTPLYRGRNNKGKQKKR